MPSHEPVLIETHSRVATRGSWSQAGLSLPPAPTNDAIHFLPHCRVWTLVDDEVVQGVVLRQGST